MRELEKSKNTYLIHNKPLFITLAIVIIIFLAITIILAQITGLDKKISTQESEINELTKTKISLEGEMMGIKSSSKIAEEAQYKLGMVYPKEDQVIYVDIDKENVTDVNDNVFLSPVISVLRSFSRD